MFTRIKNILKGNKNENTKEVKETILQQDLNVYWDPEMAKILETWGQDHVWNEIQMFLANSKGRVLDIACGTGVTINIVSTNKNLEVHGCDISDFFIQRAIANGIDKKYLRICDATHMDCYVDDFFDYSYSIGSLEHFTEEGILKFINETHRITKSISFHMVPISRSGENIGWIKTIQSYFNNSESWWLNKFKLKYENVVAINSGWKDEISTGKWFVCYKKGVE